MASMAEKLEDPRRVAELNVQMVLDRLQVSGSCSLCDIGAGTGVFALAAAARTAGTVWALELSDELLALLERRARARSLGNLRVLQGGRTLPLPDGCCGACLLATVYHELEDPAAMLAEVARVLAPGGRLGVVEFHPRPTPMGPPVDQRVSPEALEAAAAAAGLRPCGCTPLGENLYLSVFEAPA